MKVLHVLANSPPDVNGYAIRTQMILKHQKSSLYVMGLTSPWYPQRDSMIEQSQIDGKPELLSDILYLPADEEAGRPELMLIASTDNKRLVSAFNMETFSLQWVYQR